MTSPRGKRAPSARGVPVLGLVPELLVRGFVPMLEERWRRHGDLFHMRLGAEDVVVVVHPDGIRHVLKDNRENYVKGKSYDDFRLIVGDGLITLEGAAWAHRRRVAAPAFTRSSVRDLTPVVVDRTSAMLARWRREGVEGFDILTEMTRLTMDIAGRAFFARAIGADEGADDSARALAEALEVSGSRGNTALAAPLSWPTPSNLRLRRALAEVDRLIYGIVDSHLRARTEGPRPSLLERLVASRDPGSGDSLDRRALRDEAVTLFVAGHETTALTLTWAFELLSRERDAFERLAEEARAVLGEGPPTYEQIESLSYARAVVDETLRLRSPVWSLGRDAVADDVMLGYAVPAKSVVMPIPYFTHRHPDFWDAPLAFRPERFLGDEATRRHPFAYVPFSSGPRACVGMHFSLIETIAILAMVAREARLERPNRAPVGVDAQVTLRPRGPVPAVLSWRDAARG